MWIPCFFCWIWHVISVCARPPVTGMQGLECKQLGEMSVMDTWGKWELNVYIIKESGSNIGGDTYNTYDVCFTWYRYLDKNKIKKEEKWHFYTSFIGRTSRLSETMRSNSGRTAFLYRILNFIHNIFNLCDT